MGVFKRLRKFPEDLWAPLYDRCAYPMITPLNKLINMITYDPRHRRACQRQYGDNRVDHIQPLKET